MNAATHPTIRTSHRGFHDARGAAVFDRSIDRPERPSRERISWTGTVTRMRRRS